MPRATTRSLLGALYLATALATGAGFTLSAQAAAPAAPAAKQSKAQAISLLDGKLAFNLPGYDSQPVPGGGAGTMYVNQAEKRALIIGEESVPTLAKGASDADFLEGLKGISEQQKRASPDYKVTREQTERVKQLQLYHIAATTKMEGKAMLQDTLLSVNGGKFIVIQVISGAEDAPGHQATVARILGK